MSETYRLYVYDPEPALDPTINEGNSFDTEFITIEPLFTKSSETVNEPVELIVRVAPEFIVSQQGKRQYYIWFDYYLKPKNQPKLSKPIVLPTQVMGINFY